MAILKPQAAKDLDTASALLSELGLKKRRGYVFTIEMNSDVVGWLGLNRATQHRAHGEVEINPVIGVRSQPIERLVAELRGDKFHAYSPPTICTPLGYLMPGGKYKAWLLAADAPGNATADMVGAVRQYGVPFIRSMMDLKRLVEELERGRGVSGQVIYRRPAAWFLLGDFMRARESIAETVAGLQTRNDPAAMDFKKYADAFRRRLPHP